MDAGNRQVERRLFLGLQVQVGKIVGVGVDTVAELVLAADGLDQDRHPFVTQEALVALEGLPAGSVAVGVAGHTVRDLAEAERVGRVEEHQQQVGDSFESVGLCHPRQSRTHGDGNRP